MKLYNVVSPSRGLYWAIGNRGYTGDRSKAHQYSSGEADDICNSPNVDEIKVPVDSEWTFVPSYEEVPPGLWLVQIDTKSYKEYQVINSDPKLSIIGHHFAYDEARVIAYKPLGELL